MSVSVNCWYCSEDSLVPAQSRDSWECPKCDQFNSFTPDGDVTTAVAAAGAMQRPVRYNVAVQPAGAGAPRWQLCHQCNLQQQLKTRQLAAFRPVIESRWEHEMEEYERHLDKVYQPCTHCQAVVASALREADDRVRPAWLAWLQRRRQTNNSSVGGSRTVAAAHTTAASRLSRAVSAAMSLVLPAGLLFLLFLLGSSGMLTLWPELMPAPLLELQDVLSDSRSALLVLGFSAWVLTTGLSWRFQTLASLALWTAAGAVEALVGPYISNTTAAQLQIPLVTALLLMSVRTSDRRQLPVRRRVGQHVTEPAPASSTPKPECNGSTGSRHSHGAISNGHGPRTSSGGGDSGLPSPIAPSVTPAQTPTTADHDYNLPRLSLGSPRRPPGSSGVFALRTYQPTGGGALFSGGRSPAAPLLSPSRLRGELHRSSWIAGGYWQRGQPAPPPPASPPLASRTSSQSSVFVDAFSTVPPPEDERHEPRGWGGSQCDVRSCAGDTWVSCAGSQRPDWRGWPGDWRGGPAPEQETRRRHGPASGALDSSSLLSDRSGMSQGTVTSGMTVASVSHRSLLVALVLGFSMAFNLFAVLLLVYRDRL